MEYSGEFKVIDSIEKSYVLGLLMTDGCLYYNKQSGGYQVKLKLKKSDVLLLNKIHSLFPFFTIPKLEMEKNGNDSYYIYKYSKELFMDLQHLGILENKSYYNANNIFLPQLPESLFFYFLLGMFDGNGSIFQSKLGSIRIDIMGKSKNLFIQIQKELLKYNIKSVFYYRKDKDYYMLRISRKEFVKALIQRFETTTICLERKFKPFFHIDWDRIPGYDNRRSKYEVLLITQRD